MLSPHDFDALLTERLTRVVPPPDATERVSLGIGDAALRTGDHGAFLYWEPRELLRMVVPYLAAGLRAGDRVVYVADDLPTSAIVTALRDADIDVDAETKRGALTVVSSHDAFFAEGRFDVERALDGVRQLADAAAKDGYERTRFSVEMTYLLADVPGIERGVEFESRANDEIFAKYPFVCICSFNVARAVDDVVGDVLRTHSIVLRDGRAYANPYYRPWAELCGT